MTVRILVAAVVLVTGAVGVGCGPEGNNGPDGGTDAGNTNPLACGSDVTDVTAAALYTSIVEPKCKSCHFTGAGSATGGGVVMDSVDTLKANNAKAAAYGSTLKVVEANKPENSTMYLKVLGGSSAMPAVKGPKGESVGGPMPQGMMPLTDAEKKQVKDWICSGAD